MKQKFAVSVHVGLHCLRNLIHLAEDVKVLSVQRSRCLDGFSYSITEK